MKKDTALALAILTSFFHIPAAVAAEWPPPPPGYAYETDLKPHSLVVTNVVLDGVATAADLADKRDKTDLTVYKADHTARVAAQCFPIVFYGETINSERVRLYQIVPGGDYCLDIGDYAGYCSFSADGFFAYGDPSVTYGGRKPVVGEWPRLEFVSTIAPTADTLATTSTVANIARSVVNTVWDAELGVAWEARMHNGQLYYVAVTNQPPEVK